MSSTFGIGPINGNGSPFFLQLNPFDALGAVWQRCKATNDINPFSEELHQRFPNADFRKLLLNEILKKGQQEYLQWVVEREVLEQQ